MIRCCANCRRFTRHYGKNKDGTYYMIAAGHCYHPSEDGKREVLRWCKAKSTPCQHYIVREDEEE